MSTPQASPSLANRTRGWLGTVVALAHNRLALLSVETREELHRLGSLLLFGAMAVLALGVGLIFLAVFITVLLWDSQRLLALAVCTAVFMTLGGVAAWQAYRLSRQGSRLWQASLDELAQDRERLQA
jgi:uncharacterized membrane protein YqjE